MIKYLLMLKKPENEEVVSTILQTILEGDQLTDEVVQDNVARVHLLFQIGEEEIYNTLVHELLEDETYRKHMTGETGS